MTTRIRLIVGGVVISVALLLASTQVLSQDKAPPEPTGQDEMAEMMQKWLALNAKGPEHERFAEMVGTWDTEMRMWKAPDTEPTVTPGKAVFRLILDGRYVEQKYTCAGFGQPGSLPFEGLGIEGFDRFKKRYVSLWMDNTSTGIFISEGTYDEPSKTFTYYGKMDDPMTGQKDKVAKSVAREISKDKVVFEMYDTPPGGKEYMTMEITYTRKK